MNSLALHIHLDSADAAASLIKYLIDEKILIPGMTGSMSVDSAPVPRGNGAAPSVFNPYESSPAVQYYRTRFPGRKIRPAGNENRHQAAIRLLRAENQGIPEAWNTWEPSPSELIPGSEEISAPEGLDDNDI